MCTHVYETHRWLFHVEPIFIHDTQISGSTTKQGIGFRKVEEQCFSLIGFGKVEEQCFSLIRFGKVEE